MSSIIIILCNNSEKDPMKAVTEKYRLFWREPLEVDVIEWRLLFRCGDTTVDSYSKLFINFQSKAFNINILIQGKVSYRILRSFLDNSLQT